MSLILEALKKSEQQRQREKAPNLQSIHQPAAVATKKTARPWWLLAVLIVICNIAFFGYWFWHQQSNVASSVQSTSKIAPTADVPAATPTTAQPVERTPSTPATDSQPEFTRISPHSTGNATANETAPRIEEISELPDNVRNNLPAMTFSFHVYSETPEQRTIIINDRRVREGDEISQGLKLQSITQDGVILLFEQHRIHISVLSDW